MKGSDSGGGIGFIGLLQVVFITLKLIEVGPVAKWSWWFVLSPVLFSISLLIVVILGAFIFYLLTNK